MYSMKGWDDFLVVLIFGLGIIAALLLANALISFPAGAGNSTLIATLKIGSLGYNTNAPTRVIEIESFTAGERQTETLRILPQLELRASVFGSNKELFEVNVDDWLLSDANGVRITGGVDSNKAGNLVVRWNGKDFYNGMPDSLIDIFIPTEYVKESNTIELYADNVAFWAENYYLLKNVEIKLEYGPAKVIPLKLDSNDIETFERGELRFYGASTGKLSISINGKEIFNKPPRGKYTESFDLSTVPLKAGTNIISFSATNPIKISEAELRLYLYGNAASSAKEFELKADKYNMLKAGLRGKVDIIVTKIMRQSSIEVKLNGNVLPLGTVKTGVNTAYFSVDDVKVGKNSLELSTLGGFEVQEVLLSIGG